MEIIPKEAPKIPSWFNILFYVSLILAMLSIVGYFIVNSSYNKNLKTLNTLDKSLENIKSPERKVLQKEILGYQKRTKDFSILIEGHLNSSKLFSFIEDVAHPRIWFSNFALETGKSVVALSGTTDNFETLGQQVLILKANNLVEDINLEEVALTKAGKIEFSVSFKLSNQIFK